jgi:hypothetical protein
VLVLSKNTSILHYYFHSQLGSYHFLVAMLNEWYCILNQEKNMKVQAGEALRAFFTTVAIYVTVYCPAGEHSLAQQDLVFVEISSMWEI